MTSASACLSRLVRPAFLVLLAALAPFGCSSPVDDALRTEFHAALGDTSITVFPAYARSNAASGNRYEPASAARLAQWIDEHHLARTVVSSEHVPLPRDADGYQWDVWRAGASAFGAWVADHPLATAYAVLPEYLITRMPDGGTRAGGIHLSVVDARGRLVDAIVLNSHHPTFREAAAATPDECVEVLLAVLEDAWGAEAPAR